MSPHLQAMAAYRTALGIVDHPAVLTDSAPDDELSKLVRCTECRGNVGGKCMRPVAAGLVRHGTEFVLGPLARIGQNCPGFEQRQQARRAA